MSDEPESDELGSQSGNDTPRRGSYDRLAEEFERLRPLDASARDRELRVLAGEDTRLAAELTRLLQFHDRDQAPLETPEQAVPEGVWADLLEDSNVEEMPPIPPSIGPYRPVERLGAGGMGTVYLADRPDRDFDQKVAIKVLRADPGENDLWRRFRTERQILASLKHPNIAALLDGGTTEDGRAYVVLEYVEGLDLVTYCRENRLGQRARIELFRTICSAVDHAHRRLVVHRDLKPDNILVDGQGQAKLLDFGIAKLLEDTELEASIVQTQAGMSLLTPEYASPEQIRAESVTTATDVYALGAILYELLTGVRAQRFETRRAAEIERVVCERHPPAPSSANQIGGERVPQDLDAIVAKAMHKEPDRRYHSAAELSADLERLLDGHPITARPDTLFYRTRRFIARNRIAVAAGAVFAFFLVGFSITTAIQSQRIREASAKTEEQALQIREERDAARRELAVRGEISDFLVELFELSEANETSAELLLARDLLDKGRNRIENELESGPLVRAELMEAIGRAYTVLLVYENAEAMLEEAAEIRRERDARGPKFGLNRVTLAALRASAGRTDEARELYEEALGYVDESTEGQVLENRAWHGIARLEWALGNIDEALNAAIRSRQTIESLLGERHLKTADAWTVEGEMLAEAGRIDEAIAKVQAARALRTELASPNHTGHAEDLRTLSDIYRIASRFEQAFEAATEALELDRRILGETHPDTLNDMWLVSSALSNYGDDDGAIRMLQELLALETQRLGDHPYVALSKSQLAGFHSRRRDFETAERLFMDALEQQRRLLPSDHPEIATTLANLATLYNRWPDRRADALPLFEESLQMRRRLFPPDHDAVLTSMNQSAIAHFENGRPDLAEQIYREVLEIRRDRFGIHERVAGGLYGVAIALDAQGRGDEAIPLLEESLQILDQCVREDHQHVGRSSALLAKIHLDAARFEEALAPARRHLEISRYRMRADAPDVFNGTRRLTSCLVSLGRFEEAIEEIDLTLDGMKKLDDPHPQALSALQSVRRQFIEMRDNPKR